MNELHVMFCILWVLYLRGLPGNNRITIFCFQALIAFYTVLDAITLVRSFL